MNSLNFDDFLYARIPAPILKCKRLRGRRIDQLVFAEIYTSQRMNSMSPTNISINEIAKRVGTKWEHARDAIVRLEEIDLVRRRGKLIKTVVPDWIVEEFSDLVRRDRRGKLVSLRKEKSPQRGESPLTGESPQRGEPPSPLTGEAPLPRGGNNRSTKSNGKESLTRSSRCEKDHPLDGVKGAKKIRPRKPRLKKIQIPPETPRPHRTESEVPNPDGGSRAAEEEMRVAKEHRATTRSESRSRRRKPNAALDEALLRAPSKRAELTCWRDKSPDGSDWTATDVVGYFASRYLDLRGKESPELLATLDSLRRRLIPNVRKFVERWLDGDLAEAKLLVDRILTGAEERSMPVRLAYFFTPANASTHLRLGEPVRTRHLSPCERNDRRGDYEANKEYWDGEKRAFLEREAVRKARESGDRIADTVDGGAT